METERNRLVSHYIALVVLVLMVVIAQVAAAAAMAGVEPAQAASDGAGVVNVVVGILTTIGTVLLLYSLPSMATALKSGEKFDKRKIARTLLMGALVGAFLGAQGMGVTNESVAFGQMFVETGFGGIIVVFLDKLLSYVMPLPAAR